MRSHLNRAIFRKLLANEPINHSGCLQSSTRCQHALPSFQVLASRRHQRRQFFNLFGTTGQATRHAPVQADPGLDKMKEYVKMERLQARLPPPEDVARAFKLFFNQKDAAKQAVEDIQAEHVLRVLPYICLEANEPELDVALAVALKVLQSEPHQVSPAHAQLVLMLWRYLCDITAQSRQDGVPWPGNRDFKRFIVALCNCSAPVSARNILLAHARRAEDTLASMSAHELEAFNASEVPMLKFALNSRLWVCILRRLQLDGNEPETLRTLELIDELGIDMSNASTCSSMVNLYALSRDFDRAKSWYERAMTIGAKDIPDQMFEDMLQVCIATSNLEFGHSVVRDIMLATPTKERWDLVFEWAVSTGKGVDEIDRMMSVMEKANNKLHPDIATINRLVAFAISRSDPYTAERFISLGKNRHIQPNAQTLILQMEYRLTVKDIDGALTAYKHLQSHDLGANKDLPIVNNLIRAMCASGRHDFETIMNVAADLSDRQARFEPETVSALAVLHLSRDELHDVVDLLNTHISQFSSPERAAIRETFVQYCLDSKVTTKSAWDTYLILKQMFDETPRGERSQIMTDFFRRHRPDMAVHIFQHMRTHTRDDTLPTEETYIAFFMGVAREKDEESLEVVHNQLKLDYRIERNTRLNNALMLAYTACELPRRALAFWDDIASSREGPTLNSIHIALRACETSPWGDQKAKEIWERLVRTGLELDQSLWASYVGGIVGNGDVQGATGALLKGQADRQVQIDSFIIASLFNACPGQNKQAEVEAWAKEHCPAVWQELQTTGIKTTSSGTQYFDIDRHVDP